MIADPFVYLANTAPIISKNNLTRLDAIACLQTAEVGSEITVESGVDKKMGTMRDRKRFTGHSLLCAGCDCWVVLVGFRNVKTGTSGPRQGHIQIPPPMAQYGLVRRMLGGL